MSLNVNVAGAQQCSLCADNIVLGACIYETDRGCFVWEGVMKTAGQHDRAVIVKRVLSADAAVIARRDVT